MLVLTFETGIILLSHFWPESIYVYLTFLFYPLALKNVLNTTALELTIQHPQPTLNNGTFTPGEHDPILCLVSKNTFLS